MLQNCALAFLVGGIVIEINSNSSKYKLKNFVLFMAILQCYELRVGIFRCLWGAAHEGRNFISMDVTVSYAKSSSLQFCLWILLTLIRASMHDRRGLIRTAICEVGKKLIFPPSFLWERNCPPLASLQGSLKKTGSP